MVAAWTARLDSLPAEPPARRNVLRAILEQLTEPGTAPRPAEGDFERLALEVFRYQVDANPVYGRMVLDRGLDPAEVHALADIPPVPTGAFKEVSLICRDPHPVEAIFRTTGTTRGAKMRGTHEVRDLSLYRRSLLANARRYLRPELASVETDIENRIRILSLTPSPSARPDSSLAFMIGTWLAAWDDGGGGFFSDDAWGLHLNGLDEAIQAASGDDVPTLVVGTAFSFVHWLDGSVVVGPTLPEGSLVVETGGFKGRSRVVRREDLYARLSRRLGVPMRRIVNEYGMTELLSQFYEPTLFEGERTEIDRRRHIGPPWVKTRVLDPLTLEDVPLGSPGLLCHVDLANLDSVAAILTEDLGVELEDGFRLLGRLEGAEPRGCSLAMEDLMAASRAVDRR